MALLHSCNTLITHQGTRNNVLCRKWFFSACQPQAWIALVVGPLESAMSAYIDFAKSGQALTSKTNSYFFGISREDYMGQI